MISSILLLCSQTLHNFNLRFYSKQLLSKSRQDRLILDRIVKELLQYYQPTILILRCKLGYIWEPNYANL